MKGSSPWVVENEPDNVIGNFDKGTDIDKGRVETCDVSTE